MWGFFVVARFVRGHDPGSPPPNGAAAASEASNPSRTGALSLDHCLFTETGDPSSESSAQNVALDWVRCDPPLLFTSAGLRQQAWQFLEKMSPLVTTEPRRTRPRAGWYFRHPESRLEFRHLPSRGHSKASSPFSPRWFEPGGGSAGRIPGEGSKSPPVSGGGFPVQALGSRA